MQFINNRTLNINYKKLKLVFLLVFIALIIILLGLIALYSSGGEVYFKKQLQNIIISIIISICIIYISSEFLIKNGYIFYAFGVFLLILVQIFGYTSMGATRWLKIGSFRFQPSEIVKLTTIIALSLSLSNKAKLNNIKDIILPGFIISIPILLIIKQPDLGTGLILLFTSLIVLFCANISWRLIFTGSCVMFATLPIVWLNMYEYQKRRVLIFLLNDDKLNSGYNVYQSEIAIASGGKFGTGFQLGGQTQSGFLPENHTDFIFSAFAEEFGIFFASGLILLYGGMIYCLWHMCFSMQNKIHKLIILGFASLLFFHVFVNIGMVMSLLPVVGIPLPLFSYGGAMTLISIIMIAFCINLYLIDNKQE